jgi:hypothetical protein
MHFEFIDYNHIKKVKKEKNGNESIRLREDKVRETQKTKIEATRAYQVWYKGSLVLGTPNVLYNYGLKEDMMREVNNKMNVRTGFTLYAPNIYLMRTKSLVEEVEPILNIIMVCWVKLQEAIAEATGIGIAIQVDALSDVLEGAGGKMLSPLQMIAIAKTTKTLLYKGINDDGTQRMQKPVSDFQIGAVEQAVTYYNLINQNIELLRQTLGVNGITDASTPIANQTTEGTKTALIGTNNALYPFFSAEKYITEQTMVNVCIMTNNICKFGDIDKTYIGYALSDQNKQTLYATHDMDVQYSCVVEAAHDDYERMELKESAKAALQLRDTTGSGGIALEDYIKIMNIRNTKLAQRYLVSIRKKREKKDAESQMMMMQQKAEQDQQSAQMAREMEIQRMEFETQLYAKKAEIDIMKAAKLKEIELATTKEEIQAQTEAAIILESAKHENSLDLQKQGKKMDLVNTSIKNKRLY